MCLHETILCQCVNCSILMIRCSQRYADSVRICSFSFCLRNLNFFSSSSRACFRSPSLFWNIWTSSSSLSSHSLFASLSLSSNLVQKTRFCIWSSFFTSTRISSLIWSIIGPFSPLTLFTVQRQMRYRRNISAVEIVVRVNSYFSSTERVSVFGADIIYVCTNKHISIRTLP